MANNNKAIELAYCNVFGIKPKNLNPRHRAQLKEALDFVWSYPEQLPGETEIQLEERLDMTGPAQGEYVDLATHLTSLPEYANLKGKTSFEIVFTVYKRMKDAQKEAKAAAPVVESSAEDYESAPSTTESVVTANGELDLVDSSIEEIVEQPNQPTEFEASSDKKIHFKEDIQMSTSIDALKAVERDLQNTPSTEIQGGDAKPVVDAITLDAAKNMVNNESVSRIAVSRNSKILRFVFSQPAAATRAVAGEAAEGIVNKPEEALRKFMKKFDVKVVDGVPTFKKVVPGSEEDAKKIYEHLVAAVNGNNKPIKASVGKNLGSLKALELLKDDGDTVEVMSQADIANYILSKAAGVLNATAESVQVWLNKAKVSTTKPGSGKAKQAAQASNFAIKVVGRKNIEENDLAAYVKTIIEGGEVKELPGFNSELSAKYFSDKLDAEGNPKTVTYKIPLLVEQRELAVDDKYEAFASKGTFGKAEAAKDLSDDAVLKEFLDNMSATIAEAVAAGADNDIVNKVRQTADATKAAESKKTAEEMDV